MVDHVDEDEVGRGAGGDAVRLGVGETEVREDPFDEVVHHRLTIGGEADVDGARSTRLDEIRRGGDVMAPEKRVEQPGTGGADAADHLAAHAPLRPVVGHVERAAARQLLAGVQIPIDAEWPDEAGGDSVVHRPARGSLRRSPSATNRS